MNRARRRRWILGFGLVLAVFSEHRARGEEPPTYEADVRPILKAHCFHCHGEDAKLRGDLDLRLRRFILRGGKSGAAVTPGDPGKSLLLRRVRLGEMPPGDEARKLSPPEIDVIRRWIERGAPTAGPEPESLATGLHITDEERRFWSFQPIRRPDVPVVAGTGRVRTPVDAFLLARLEKEGLSLGAPADRRTLIRRACLDLLGLPPSPGEIEEFLADDAPDAWERLLDRLLASPRHGERWGRHWLDVAGYADSEGYTDEDPVRKWAWKYRDWVIQSLNRDTPLDRFIREQLAGDEMVAPPHQNLSPDEIEKLVATGFLRLAPDGTDSGNVDADVARNQTIADTIQIISGALLGITVGCARCHHHRYDPIPQEDYYRLRAIFEPALDWRNWRLPRKRLVSLYTDADRARSREIEAGAKKVEELRARKQEQYIQRTLEKELAKIPADVRERVRAARNTPEKKRTGEESRLLRQYPSVNVSAGSLYLYDRKAADELKKLADEAARIRAGKPAEEFVRALTEIPGKVPVTHLFHRGDHEQPGQALEPAGLTVLSAGNTARIPVNDESLPTTGRRLAWARRLTNGAHPLVARVLANRIWMHHFGRGLVDTPGDFGALGARPTHPELLDWLASELMESGWSLKRLHRLIMTSTAYRQTPWRAGGSGDPENRLYGGMPIRRLEAEAIRDAILAVSGKLNLEPFGPPVPVMADRVGQFVIGIENLNAGRPGAVVPMKGQEFRRSVWIQVRRTRPLTVLDTFDAPRMEPSCEKRASSTVAPQALMLMNSEFVLGQSESFAGRLRAEAGDDSRARVRRAWLLALGREPDHGELEEAVTFLEEQARNFESREGDEVDPRFRALASFCQALISSNEFLHVD